MSVANEVEVANAAYAASFTKGGLGLPPQRLTFIFTCFMAEEVKWKLILVVYRKLAIVACMDARLGMPTHLTYLTFPTSFNTQFNSLLWIKTPPKPLVSKKATPTLSATQAAGLSTHCVVSSFRSNYWVLGRLSLYTTYPPALQPTNMYTYTHN